MFQKPNILRKKPKKEVVEPGLVEGIPVTMPSRPLEKLQTKHRCSKPMQRITLDSYICEEYRIRKLQSGSDPPSSCAGSAADSTSKPAVNVNVNLAKELTGNCNTEKIIPRSRSKFLCEKNAPNLQNNNPPKKLQIGDIADNGLKNVLPSTIQVQVKVPTFTVVKTNVGILPPKARIVKIKAKCLPTAPQLVLRRSGTTLSAEGDTAQVSSSNGSAVNTSSSNCPDTTEVSVKVSTPTLKANKKCSSEPSAEEEGVFKPILDCPARKGDPPLCELVFNSRDDLIKHLKEDHVPEDAPYKCEICGRTFFWMSGLRAHVRSHHASRHQFVCSWPGCDRVFLQACRLKEHRRAHTGDKPYPCLHPSCGWAFRTASKLMRHARRHTGERRFSCRVCGRAFRRAEHRREHEERHAQPQGRYKHRCTVEGCEQKFSNKSSFYLHMKKAHTPPTPPEPEEPPPPLKFMINENGYLSLVTPSDEEYRAARTHITWPLDHSHKDIPSECLLTDSEGENNPLCPYIFRGTDNDPLVDNNPYNINGESKKRLVEASTYIVGKDGEQQLENIGISEQNLNEVHSYVIGAGTDDALMEIFGLKRKPSITVKSVNNHNESGVNSPYISGDIDGHLIGSSNIENEALPIEALSFVAEGGTELASYIVGAESSLPDYLHTSSEEISSGLSYIMDGKTSNPSSYTVEKQNLGGPLVQASSYLVNERSQGLESSFVRGRRNSDFVVGGEGSRMSESSESNVCTLRSDLFLHGNGHHEDSQLAMRASDAVAEQCGMEPVMMHLGTELGLVDSSAHLQEELMYSDPGVDESSFQVLLLSGEDGC